MRLKRYAWLLLPITAFALLFYRNKNSDQQTLITLQAPPNVLGVEDDEEDDEAKFTEERLRHEFEMLRNPVTKKNSAKHQEHRGPGSSKHPL